MKNRSLYKVLMLALVLAGLTLPAEAQVASSTSLTGTVTDPSGAIVPGASVRAVNTGTQVAYPTTTNQSGIYNILYIPVGTYTITVKAHGFATMVHTNIIVGNNQTVRTDFALHVGAASTSIQVTAVSPPLVTDSPTVGQTIPERSINQLPVNGEDPLKLATTNSSVMLNNDNPQGNPPGERFQGAGTRPCNLRLSQEMW